jgi:periplasmic divalent cation tolerance protein
MKKRATTITVLLSTFPSKRSAAKVCNRLIDQRLIACGIVIDGCASTFLWKGKKTAGNEVLLLCKTRKSAALRAAQMIESEHPYDCPCVLTFSPKANSRYAAWLLHSLG